MRICGVISEYNPFHSGHAALLHAVREELGADCGIVCCMSGNFVQRGEAALMPKHLRAEAAVRCGADLVLELPAPYALRSAEGFAESGVAVLSGLGCLTHLSFGAEDADRALLLQTAEILLEHSTVQQTLLQLREGISYAAARERALYARIQERTELLKKPNNILAVEYCKSIRKQQLSLEILPIHRVGAAHDGTCADETASASFLREQIRCGHAEQALPFLPEGSETIFHRAQEKGLLLTDPERLEAQMLSQWSRLTPEMLSHLPDAAEGLENRLYEAIHSQRSADSVAQAAKTKRYALSRIRRMLCCAFLGITAEDEKIPAPYIRILAFNDCGREILRRARKQASLPLLTKPAHIFDLGAEAQRIFALENRACDAYHLALPAWRELPWGSDFRQDAIYVR